MPLLHRTVRRQPKRRLLLYPKRRPPIKQYIRIEGQHVSREIILKIHGRCNLKCTYCYRYESKDQSWRDKPAFMSKRTVRYVAFRFAQYAREHNLDSFRIVLHGGEPLKAGMKRVRFIVEEFRRVLPEGFLVHWRMQTNGTMFSEKTLLELAELGIKLGVSLDGDEEGNQRRILLSGRPSYPATMRGIGLLAGDARWSHLFERVLCVVDLRNNPEETMRTLFHTGAQGADFLLPLQNHDTVDKLWPRFSGATPFADWLIRAFWEMYRLLEAHPESTFHVRLFKQIIRLIRYKAAGWPLPWRIGVDVIGPPVVPALLVETDGTFELLDGLKTVREGEAYTGLSVQHDLGTKALVTVLDTVEQRGTHELPTACLPCPKRELCGAGHYPHRWSSANGYNNPSFYCADLIKLFDFFIEFAWPVIREQENLGIDALDRLTGSA